MTKASDNAFPSILITEGTEPSAPAAGKQRVYIDSTTHHLMRTNSSGTETDIEAGSSGIPATIIDAKGDLIAGSAADTAARLAVGSNTGVLTADSSQSTGLAWWVLAAGKVDRTNIGSDLTIASTTWAYMDTTNLAITITTRASRCLMTLSGRLANTSSGAFTRFGLDIDGTPVHTESAGSNSITGFRANGTSVSDGFMVVFVTNVLSAGSHTFKPRWNCSTGTTTAFQSASTDHISFAVVELPTG